MGVTWSLYNSEEKLRIDDLTTEHVRIILLSISARRLPEWMIYQSAESGWQPLAKAAEFRENLENLMGLAVLQPTKKPSKPPVLRIGAGAQKPVTRTRIHAKDRRSAKRYSRQLKFHAFVEGKNFECDTIDISLSGLALSKKLPLWLPKTFRATLRLKETLVLILCTRVNDTKLKILECDSWNVIRQWMVNW